MGDAASMQDHVGRTSSFVQHVLLKRSVSIRDLLYPIRKSDCSKAMPVDALSRQHQTLEKAIKVLAR